MVFRCSNSVLTLSRETRLFITAIESVEYESKFHKLPKSEGFSQWTWLFEKHGQCHALALILLELSERPIFDSDGLFERGWAAVTAYNDPDRPKGHSVRPYKAPLFEPIVKLREKVMRRKMNATPPSNCDGGASDMVSLDEYPVPTAEEQPINWVCCFPSPGVPIALLRTHGPRWGFLFGQRLTLAL